MSIAAKCTCGASLFYCNGSDACNNKIKTPLLKTPLIDFFSIHECTEEEQEQLFKYLKAIRIVNNLDEIKQAIQTIKSIL